MIDTFCIKKKKGSQLVSSTYMHILAEVAGSLVLAQLQSEVDLGLGL